MNPERSWEEELAEIWQQEIIDGNFTLEELLMDWPTREIWQKDQDSQYEWQKNSELFQQLRQGFKDDNEFDEFLLTAKKNISALTHYVAGEQLDSFHQFLLRRKVRTSGAKKLMNYFGDLLKRKEFNADVLVLRQQYDIPAGGFAYTTESEQYIDKQGEGFMDEELFELTAKYGLYNVQWMDVFRKYILFGRNTLRDRWYYLDAFDLCAISDEKSRRYWDAEETGGYEDADDIAAYRERARLSRLRKQDEYPVTIHVSPYASERDILDFVKARSFEIAQAQKVHLAADSKIGKIKKRSSLVQERNDFIYEHRDLPYKEIMGLVNDKFGWAGLVDPGYIGKIISLERKKRGQ